MIPRPDLRKLLDDVAMRATRIEIVVDARLEQSVQATVHTDRHGDATVALTRYAADSAADALEAVLVDAARWSNAQPSVRRPIAIGDMVEMRRDLFEELVESIRGLASGQRDRPDVSDLLARLEAA